MKQTKESKRLNDSEWKFWGPYLSERQWGTVREDYSEHGTAWEYFPHEHARSRIYRWGEDGIGGLSDSKQNLCFSLALWNGKDKILKERLFGLTGNEGNHAEDVKELYYYLDSSPTHSYMRMLYKYPQAEFPYAQLVSENRKRGKKEPEYEIMDTGIFERNEYFDIFIDYAKASPKDILIKIVAHNRGKTPAPLSLIPQIWFRNNWSWGYNDKKPSMKKSDNYIKLSHPRAGNYFLYSDGSPEIVFCENETNFPRIFGYGDPAGIYKDGLHDYIISGKESAIKRQGPATKAGIHYKFSVAAGESVSIMLRLSNDEKTKPFSDFEKEFHARKNETNDFYEALQHDIADADAKLVQRQAFAGLLWSKQYYYFNVYRWLKGDPAQPKPPAARLNARNSSWQHLNNADIISMPDKWEYPWYAAWDLAFHCIPFALIDSEFAKQQLTLLTSEWYMHPNGQIPAYEWAFGDVNPPVHAWACWRVYKIEQAQHDGKGDLAFLERVFHKLLVNFTWWVNRKDAEGHNVFQGGFLGLDNIGVFDRSAPLPGGGHIEQADGTAWMAMYCLNMMRIALELSLQNPVYQDMAAKFLEHFLYIADAMFNMAGEGIQLWDEEDKFYYDVLHSQDGQHIKLKVRSMVGLIPLFAVEIIEPELLEKVPAFKARLEWFLNHRPDLARLVSRWEQPGKGERRLFSLLRGHRMKRLLSRLLDEKEFFSDYGIRALSKYHEKHPYKLTMDGTTFSVSYQPGESDSRLFGGNSNWRGPIWFPVNYLLLESLQRFHYYYGDDFKIECPSGSGKSVTIQDAANELAERLKRIFVRDSSGHRAVFGNNDKLQSDPHFKDYLLFYEYFHGDSGRGVGASHQCGWTAIIAKILQPRRPAGSVK